MTDLTEWMQRVVSGVEERDPSSPDDISWVRREMLGLVLVETWSKRTAAHDHAHRCPKCDQDMMAVGLPRLVYSFEECDCGTPEWPHLIEQLWHAKCFQTAHPTAESMVAALEEIANSDSRRVTDYRYAASRALNSRVGGSK